MANTAQALRPGTVLNNRYTIQNVIGSGGFGITYRAYDMAMQILCCIKELFPRNLCIRYPDGVSVGPINTADPHQYYHSKERFGEEALSLQTLRNVRSVVNVTDYFEQHGTCYFVMEYLDGLNLRQLAQRNGGYIPWVNLSEIAQKAGDGLAQVHYMRIFHRDISPDNILLTRDLKVKLIDFGNAKELARTNNEGLSVFLKPGFAPLEQYSTKRPQGTYTDVYSFAATLYFLLTGTKVPDAIDRSTGNGYAPLVQYGLPQYVSDGIDRALHINYRERTQTIPEVLYNLGLNPNSWMYNLNPYGSNSPGAMTGGTPGGASGVGTDLLPDNPGGQYQGQYGGVSGSVTEEIPEEPQNETPGNGYTDQNGGQVMPPPKQRAVLEVHYNNVVTKYVLPPNECIMIGKSPQRSNIVISAGFVSREHLEVMYDSMAREMYVQDCGSSNGTYVNDYTSRMVPRQIMKIPFDTKLFLGGASCWVLIRLENE